MARASSADKVLAEMVRDYKRMRRGVVQGQRAQSDPELEAMRAQLRALEEERRELRRQIAAAKKSTLRSLRPEDAEALAAIRGAIDAVAAKLEQLGSPAPPAQGAAPQAPAALSAAHRRRRRRRLGQIVTSADELP
ncbi:MAG: hypothetical protein EYC70_01450 [Planctomycetota bacterium]|nr:MAG: hypothetical protein EYC70_01450 [Planctomycetota bacterium]